MMEKEIKEANRRAMPKFLVFVAACCAVGFLGGFFTAFLEVDHYEDIFKRVGEFFIYPIAPWMLIALVFVNFALFRFFYGRAKRLMISWDGEDEEKSEQIENLLSKEIGISSLFYILAIFLFAAGNSGFWMRGGMNPVSAIGLAAFFVLIFETVLIQQKCVDAEKRMNPEKAGSVYDTKFHQKWMDSSDEAERIMIGKCAYKAFQATNHVCGALAVILAVLAMFSGMGFIPSFVVCLIWAVNQGVYIRESILISRSGTRIF